jgi:Fe2+ transport system protein B
MLTSPLGSRNLAGISIFYFFLFIVFLFIFYKANAFSSLVQSPRAWMDTCSLGEVTHTHTEGLRS